MDTVKTRYKINIRKGLFFFAICVFMYIATFVLDSFFGGYWTRPEMDGRDRYSFGLAMPTAFMWQPLFGHQAVGNDDFLGVFYEPLIRLDRQFIHPTIYLSDENEFEKVSGLPIAKIHPHWRDIYAAKVKITVEGDESAQAIRCNLQLTGSNRERELAEIQIPRELVKSIEAIPPKDFTEKPFEDYRRWKNEKTIRWLGKLSLPPNKNAVLIIPAAHLKSGSGNIRFQYLRADDMSLDSVGQYSIQLN